MYYSSNFPGNGIESPNESFVSTIYESLIDYSEQIDLFELMSFVKEFCNINQIWLMKLCI